MLIGTAGHIDHGKTTLVRALTGVAGDRLPEEKKRGMTIELGYAFAPLTGGGQLAFIDVPGHEKFVPTMVNGAAGIDCALLVIAADDGVMAQTREHLGILDLLGITRGAVAITKCDRVDAARLAAVRAEIHAALAPTTLHAVPLFAVAAGAADGAHGELPALRERLEAQAKAEVVRADHAHAPRLAVDRHFALAGAGTIVTGTLLAGQLGKGDALLLARADGPRHAVRVRGLHANNQATETGLPGQRCAVNLSGVDHHAIERGDWLTAEALAQPRTRLDLAVRWLADVPRALLAGTWLSLHHPAGAAQARLVLLDETPAPDGTLLMQAMLDRPIFACHGDRLILRDSAGRQTWGGARVLDPAAPTRHRRTPQRLAELAALAEPDPATRLARLLAQAPFGLASDALAAAHNRAPDAWLASLPAEAVVRVPAGGGGEQIFTPTTWAALGEAVCTRLAAHHAASPDEPGVERERLRRMLAPNLAGPVFLARLEALLAEGRLCKAGAAWHLPEHTAELDATDRALADTLLAHLADGAFDPPWVRDLAAHASVPEAAIRRLLLRLATRGEVYQVVRDLFYPAPTVAALVAHAAACAAADPVARIRAAAFRDRIGGGRKRAIQILEFFDRIGYTRRVGEGRERAHVIRGESPVSAA